MSLREAIKNLRGVARRLDSTKFNPDMSALEKFLDGIKVDKPALPPEAFLKTVLAKFLRGERNFSPYELRALPFIIYEPDITSHNTTEILRRLDFSRTIQVRGVMFVYLLNYDDTNKTERLRQVLNELRGVRSVSLRKIFAARDKLFGNKRFANMTKLFAQKLSVADSLDELGLKDFYKTSNFIQVALKIFFRADVPLAAQFKILDELDAEFDTYKNIFPAAADALIRNVARAGSGKDKCVEIFYRRLGDPRFGNTRFNWDGVSAKSVNIFSQWLSAEDLETFFELIRKTAVDSMWRYREKFWRAYLPNIIKTKIFLGNTAKVFAAQIGGLNHGTLRGAAADQSVFVFQIGRYIFSEWSHNGTLRVHKIDENLFEREIIKRDDLPKSVYKDGWRHFPNIGPNSWQNKVSAWLEENCGV